MNQAATKKKIHSSVTLSQLLAASHPFPLSSISLSAAVAAAAVGRGWEFDGREKIKIPSFHSCRP